MCLQQKRHLQGKTFKQQYYLLHPNYEETTLRSKEAYVFNLWYQYNSFCLLFRFSMVHYCDLLVTKSCYGCSADNVCENISSFGLGLTVYVLSRNYDVYFYIYWLQHEILGRYYHCIAFRKTYILSNLPPFQSYS